MRGTHLLSTCKRKRLSAAAQPCRSVSWKFPRLNRATDQRLAATSLLTLTEAICPRPSQAHPKASHASQSAPPHFSGPDPTLEWSRRPKDGQIVKMQTASKNAEAESKAAKQGDDTQIHPKVAVVLNFEHRVELNTNLGMSAIWLKYKFVFLPLPREIWVRGFAAAMQQTHTL